MSSRILKLILQLNQEDLIDSHQKDQLKGLILNEDQRILKLTNYQNQLLDEDIKTLLMDVLQDKEITIDRKQQINNSEESSPLDDAIFKRKSAQKKQIMSGGLSLFKTE